MVLVFTIILVACTLQCLPHHVDGHSWVVKVGLDGGRSRGGVDNVDEHVLQRYFCPLDNLADCQPDPKHEITLTPDALRPCRAGVESSPRSVIERGDFLYLSWMGNGHVNNGQSEGWCVRLMMTPYDPDPDFSSFVELPGGSCIDYWHFNSAGKPVTETEIEIPASTPPGKYTVLWYWTFTDFVFSSCIDIDVTAQGVPTPAPNTSIITPTPTPDVTENPWIDSYLNYGCTDLPNPDTFCVNYLGTSSYCKTWNMDECQRSACHGGDFLLPCHSDDDDSDYTLLPTSTPTPPPPSGEDDDGGQDDNALDIYLDEGCATGELSSSFCSDYFSSYCKNYQEDECQRSICQGHAFDYLNECHDDDMAGPDNDLALYRSQGCTNLSDPDGFCASLNAGSYCKEWQSDHCGRSICHGRDYTELETMCA